MLTKIATAALAVLLTTSAGAQESAQPKSRSPLRKGNTSVGLNVDLPRIGMDYNKSVYYNLRLNPNAGYFVTNNLMILGQMHAGASQSERSFVFDRWQTSRTQSVGGGLDFRWYFGSPETKSGAIRHFRLYAEAGGSILQKWNQEKTDGNYARSNGYAELELRGGVGASYLITPRFALESSLIYRQFAVDYRPGSGEGVIEGQLGFRFFLK